MNGFESAVTPLLAATGLAIVFTDKQLNLLRYTPDAADLLNLDASMLGQCLTALKLDSDSLLTAKDVARILQTGQPEECQLQSHDGHWYTRRINPCQTSSLGMEAAVITFIDITHAVQTEQELRKNERFLRESQKIGRIGSYITDLSTGHWIVSPEMYAVFGIDENYPHTLEGWIAFLHPETKDELINYHLQVERERKRFDYEYKIVRINDGAERWVHGLGDIEYDEDGNPARRIGTIQDITERRLAQDELRIAAVAFDSQNRMIITDPKGIILRVNTAFIRATGFTAEESVGRPVYELLRSERHHALFYEQLLSVLGKKLRWQGEIWSRYKDDQIYANLVTINAVLSPQQEVTHYVASFTDVSEDKDIEAEIHRLAYYDPLTRLPNRRLLQERLALAAKSAARNGRYGALFSIDLDNFKALNDSRGHDAGDLLLLEIAQRFQAIVREGDTVARQGGDEFIILLENLGTAADDASALAGHIGEKLMQALRRPFDLNGYQYHCHISIGITLIRDNDGDEILFKQADLALYQAKTSGRNTLRFYDPALRAELDLRSSLELELQQAIAKQQMTLMYQPQVDADGDIFAVEALLRWHHPQRGLLMPNDFIPLAEDCGCIHTIGYWVQEQACQQLRRWENHPRLSQLQISVNVSPRQFRQTDFVAQIVQLLQNTGAQPVRLKLELIESLVLENIEDTIAKMKAIKQMGIRFAMDDFGTGYSSLSYLAQLPLHQLKIDRSFVHNLSRQGNDETIARTIISMGQGLSMEVIAEGVETQAQLQLLQAFGCRLYQGFLFCQPVTVEKLEHILLRPDAASMSL